MDAKERMIRSLELFDGCSGDEVRWAMKHGDVIDVRAGSVLAQDGGHAHEFVVIVRGAVTASRHGSVSVLGAGAWFGNEEISTDRPHSATIESLDGLRVLAFEVRAFRGFAECLPTVARKLSGERSAVAVPQVMLPRLATAS